MMVGEVRDSETANIAVQAALTGHLVLATLHTNDSASAVTRLLELGVDPFLLSSTLVGVVAQRLVRVICPSCRIETFLTPDQMSMLGLDVRAEVDALEHERAQRQHRFTDLRRLLDVAGQPFGDGRVDFFFEVSKAAFRINRMYCSGACKAKAYRRRREEPTPARKPRKK